MIHYAYGHDYKQKMTLTNQLSMVDCDVVVALFGDIWSRDILTGMFPRRAMVAWGARQRREPYPNARSSESDSSCRHHTNEPFYPMSLLQNNFVSYRTRHRRCWRLRGKNPVTSEEGSSCWYHTHGLCHRTIPPQTMVGSDEIQRHVRQTYGEWF